MLPPSAAAILLDRDGVIVEPVPDPILGTFESPLHAADVRLVERAAEAAAALSEDGWRLFVVSNQPAAAKGTVDLEELRAVHQRTVELLAARGVAIEGWEYCFHHPDGAVAELTGDCDCRKPRAGMLIGVIEASGFEPGRCWMVGDADTDVVAGRLAGVQTALLEHPLTGHRRAATPSAPAADLRASDLWEFAETLAARDAPRFDRN